MGLLPSIASTLSYSIPAGPVGMVWVSGMMPALWDELRIDIYKGWFLASGFIFIVGLAMVRFSRPTGCALLYWTSLGRSRVCHAYVRRTVLVDAFLFFAQDTKSTMLPGWLQQHPWSRRRLMLDWLWELWPHVHPETIYSRRVDAFALMFLSVIVVARDGNWTPSNGVIYGTFLACVCCHGILASTMSRIMGKLQTVFVVANFILIFATIIALPIGARHNRNDGHYIFAQTENSTTWPTGWAFMLAWLSPIWTIGGFDSCVHMSEEAANATKAVVRSKMCPEFEFLVHWLDCDSLLAFSWPSGLAGSSASSLSSCSLHVSTPI